MTQQPTLFSQGAPVPPQSPEKDPGQCSSGRHEPSRRQVPPWLQYLELSIRVIVRLYLGFFIVLLPWTHLWSNNRLLLMAPHLALIALNGVTRGLVSGLGLLNMWIGISDAIHFRRR
jgi:hypothetical protein